MESKVASNKAFLKAKEIKVSNEIKSIVALISHDTKSEIIIGIVRHNYKCA